MISETIINIISFQLTYFIGQWGCFVKLFKKEKQKQAQWFID